MADTTDIQQSTGPAVADDNRIDDRAITVIGAGLVGLCTSLFLQERGYKVTIIDRLPPAEGCSYGNAGILCAWSCSPFSVPGIWRSVPQWLLDGDGPIALRWRYLPRALPWLTRFLAAGKADRLDHIADALLRINQPVVTLYRQLLGPEDSESLIRDSRYIHCFRSPDAYDPKQTRWQLAHARGAPITVHRGSEVRELEPALSKDYQVAVAVGGQGFCVNPGEMGKRLAARVARQGGNFRYGNVHGIVANGDGFDLLTDDAKVYAPKLVVCGGAFSQRLLAPLGIDIPLETERGYHLMISRPGVSISNALTDGDYHFAATPMRNDTGACVRIAGTTEFAGLDAPPNPKRFRMLERLGRRMFPDLNFDETSEWMGHRPSLPDSLPVLGAIGGHKNLFAGFGHGHLGVTGAPMSGRVLAAVVDGDRPDVDLDPYRADRF